MRLMFSLHLQTELRFVCNEAAVQDFIGDIFEPQSCEYTVLLYIQQCPEFYIIAIYTSYMK